MFNLIYNIFLQVFLLGVTEVVPQILKMIVIGRNVMSKKMEQNSQSVYSVLKCMNQCLKLYLIAV